MKRIFLLSLSFVITGLFIFISIKNNSSLPQEKKTSSITPTPQNKIYTPFTKSIFVPYWQMNDDSINIDKEEITFTSPVIPSMEKIKTTQTIYFGITANSHGIDTTESGYKHIIHIPSDQKDTLLVFHLSNTTILETILSDDTLFHNLSKDVIHIARKYNYNGILLDLEIQGIPTDKTIEQITSFVDRLSNELKQVKLTYAMTLFGDQFYRHRPYDLKALQKSVDHFYIMAYDLHKATGEPGPNFPLQKGTMTEYDLSQAIDQFISFIPSRKITVVFGMYGYDWIVDAKKRPIKKAQSLTLAHIKKNFIDTCSWKNCVVKRDVLSEETEINYVEPPLTYHIVWFEDEQSVEKKIQALLKKGIVHYAFWAWGYY